MVGMNRVRYALLGPARTAQVTHDRIAVRPFGVLWLHRGYPVTAVLSFGVFRAVALARDSVADSVFRPLTPGTFMGKRPAGGKKPRLGRGRRPAGPLQQLGSTGGLAVPWSPVSVRALMHGNGNRDGRAAVDARD